jgi:hypothetical protein
MENFPGKTFQGKLSREKGKREKGSPKEFAGEAEYDEDCCPGPQRGPHEVLDHLRRPESCWHQWSFLAYLVFERNVGMVESTNLLQ